MNPISDLINVLIEAKEKCIPIYNSAPADLKQGVVDKWCIAVCSDIMKNITEFERHRFLRKLVE